SCCEQRVPVHEPQELERSREIFLGVLQLGAAREKRRKAPLARGFLHLDRLLLAPRESVIARKSQRSLQAAARQLGQSLGRFGWNRVIAHQQGGDISIR